MGLVQTQGAVVTVNNLLLVLNIWLVLTALWLLVTFRKFALVGAGAVILKAMIFAAFVFGIMRLPEAAGVLVADTLATTLLMTLRTALVGAIILVTIFKVIRRRTHRHMPTIL